MLTNYFQWVSLRNELGADGDNIKVNSDRLPSGWLFPTGGNDDYADWYKILKNAPTVAIQVEKSDNTVEIINAAEKSVTFVTITKDEKTYNGLLLLRDGTFIPKEGNLQYWGKSSSPNNITYEQYLILKDAGCLFLSSTGYYSPSFGYFRDAKEGHYWSATDRRSSSKGFQCYFYIYNNKLDFSPATSSNSEYYCVRLVKKL